MVDISVHFEIADIPRDTSNFNSQLVTLRRFSCLFYHALRLSLQTRFEKFILFSPKHRLLYNIFFAADLYNPSDFYPKSEHLVHDRYSSKGGTTALWDIYTQNVTSSIRSRSALRLHRFC